MQFQFLDIDGVLVKASSCGVFHADMGVYIDTPNPKPRLPQKNNREEVSGKFIKSFPLPITFAKMTLTQFKKWGPLLPSQYTPAIMKSICNENKDIYDIMNVWFWNIRLTNKVHYLYGWLQCKLTHSTVSVSTVYIYRYIHVYKCIYFEFIVFAFIYTELFNSIKYQ